MSNSTFTCEHCGRHHRWKPEIAGKRAKCGCGEVISVPAQLEDELYDFAESVAATPQSSAKVVVGPLPSGHTALLGYQRTDPKERDRGDSFYDRPRDFYIPTAVLTTGFIGLFAWAIFAGASGGGLIFFSIYITFATLLKTAVMIGAAFVIAPIAGVSFGGVWTAVLKLAAIVVMTDAALFWLGEIMQATGAYPSGSGGGRSFMGVAVVNTLLACAVIAILLRYFFDMDREEVGQIATPLAILNRLLNFIMMLILGAIVAAVQSAASAPAPVAVTPPTTMPAAARPTNPDVIESDERIAKQIAVKGFVEEAKSYYEHALENKIHRDFVYELYGLGARKVHFRLGRSSKGIRPVEMFVELPDAPSQRQGLISRLRSFVSINKLDGSTLQDNGNQYLAIPLPPSER